MQERFNKQFVDEGLLNIGKYDYDEVIKFIEGEFEIIRQELLEMKIKQFKRLGYTGETHIRQNCIDEILNFINKSNETT
jgi:hypothetical protein